MRKLKFPTGFTDLIKHKIKLNKNILEKLSSMQFQDLPVPSKLVAEGNLKTNPTKLQSFISSKKNVSAIPERMVHNGNELVTAQDIVEGFAPYFNSVFVSDNESIMENNNVTFHNISVLHKYEIITYNMEMAVMAFSSQSRNIINDRSVAGLCQINDLGIVLYNQLSFITSHRADV